MRKRGDEVQRFLSKVHKQSCWLWLGYKMHKGYGRFCFRGRTRSAHRVSWMLFKGPIPDNLFVCHACDNRGCVNPDHLFLGTAKDNSLDMVKKGRACKPDPRVTHCPSGHEYTPNNLVRRKVLRKDCRACANTRLKLYKEEKCA